jgi:hypothetical protein
MGLPPLAPKASVSTNSTTTACRFATKYRTEGAEQLE